MNMQRVWKQKGAEISKVKNMLSKYEGDVPLSHSKPQDVKKLKDHMSKFKSMYETTKAELNKANREKSNFCCDYLDSIMQVNGDFILENFIYHQQKQHGRKIKENKEKEIGKRMKHNMK